MASLHVTEVEGTCDCLPGGDKGSRPLIAKLVRREAPKECENLNTFDKSKFEPLWVECRYKFSNSCRSKLLLNIIYNLLIANQIDFLEQLLNNINNAICESLPTIMMGDYNWISLQRLSGKV